MLKITHLTKYYDKTKPVISDLNLEFPDTGLVIITGKSGCGKTTLLNMVGTIDQKYIGSINIDGLELSTLSSNEIADFRNFQSSFIFQQSSLFDDLTVEQNMHMILELQCKETNVNISDALERVGLKGFEKKKIKSLSGGERQRIAIARSLVKDCKIIMADEPTSALDSKNSHKIFQLLKDLSKERLVLLVSHDTKKAYMYADRVIKLVDGHVEEDIINNDTSAREAVKVEIRKSKKNYLMGFFFRQLKKSFIIMFFTMVLLSALITVVNVAREQKIISDEYKDYANEQYKLNVDRTIDTLTKNNINLFNVLKVTDEEDPYEYLRTATTQKSNLIDADVTTLKEKDINELVTNSTHKGILIQGASQNLKCSTVYDGVQKYWHEPQVVPYGYYEYNNTTSYDIKYGRRPTADDEIMITDTVALAYLTEISDTPLTLTKQLYESKETISIEERDALDASYDWEYINDNKGNLTIDYLLDKLMIVGDIYERIVYPYEGADHVINYYVNKTFKIVGIINTNQLQYYPTYDVTSKSYTLLNTINQQITGDYNYLNILKYQPIGYLVVPNGLNSYKTNSYIFNDIEVHQIQFNGNQIKTITTANIEQNYNKVSTFHGTDDFKEINIVQDDLQKDTYNRLLALDTTDTNLKNNEIIISAFLARQIFKGLNLSFTENTRYNEIRTLYPSHISGSEITLRFRTDAGIQDIEFKIVGVSRDTARLSSWSREMLPSFYVSEEMFADIYNTNQGNAIPQVTLDLYKQNDKERKALMEDLYKDGYILAPVEIVPGGYNEFVEGKGLYERIDDFGDTIVENTSLYHLYSTIYNTDEMNGTNSTLEIIYSISVFCIVLCVIIILGLYYLKERRQKQEFVKLSMICVKQHEIFIMDMITYVVSGLLVIIISIFVSQFVINIINNIYTLDLNGAYIYRTRLLFSSSSLTRCIVSGSIAIAVGIITAFISSKVFRK